MAHLEVIMPDGSRRTHPLADQPVLIGREMGCDIRLEQESASRRHARITNGETGYCIEDLGSVNGTWVNGQRVDVAPLHHGDRLAIQDFEALFVDDAPASAVTLSDLGTTPQFRSRPGSLETLALSHKRLTSLYELTNRLTRLRELPELLAEAATICFETLEFERGAIGLRRAERGAIDWPVVRNLRGSDGGLTLSRTMIARALERGERLIMGGEHGEISTTQSMHEFSICAAMCVPLMFEGETLGVLYGDRVNPGREYTDEDADFLFALANQVSVGVTNARLMAEQKRHARLESEVALAREAQQFLFPKTLPQSNDVSLAATNAPGRHVSGDYYDALALGDDKYAFLIADVSGKGMAASLLGGSLHGVIHTTLPAGGSPAALLSTWNAFVCHHTDGLRFVTCALGILDARQRTLTLSVAGHPPPLMRTAGETRCQTIAAEVGMPLGIDESAEYHDTRIDLPDAGCTLVLFSDGVTEAKNIAREEFELAGIEATIAAALDQSPQALIHTIEKAIAEFAGDCPQYDDITLLAVQLARITR